MANVENDTDKSEIFTLRWIVLKRDMEVEQLRKALEVAHRGLRRALDYRAATPEGLAIKADIRETLIKSGDPGPWGVVGSG